MKAKKWVLRVVLGVIALVILALVGVWLMINPLAKSGVQRGGEYALGVPTSVSEFNLSLVNGSLVMDKLKVANPSGFKTPHLIQTGHLEVQLLPSSVLGSPIVVQKFILDGLDVNIEQAGGKNNVSAILDHVRQQFGGGSAQAPAQPAQPAGQAPAQPVNDQGGGTKVKISLMTIKNVVAHVTLPLGGKELTIKVPEITLTNVSSDDKGATISAVIAKVVPAVLASVVKSGGDILPAELAGTLNADLTSTTKTLGSNVQHAFGQASSQATALVDEAGKTLGQPGKASIQDAQKSLGGLKATSLPALPILQQK